VESVSSVKEWEHYAEDCDCYQQNNKAFVHSVLIGVLLPMHSMIVFWNFFSSDIASSRLDNLLALARSQGEGLSLDVKNKTGLPFICA